MTLNEKQRGIGKDNFSDAVRITRRQLLAGGVAAPLSVTAAYWGYDELKGNPVRVGIVGTGDQGKAHIRSSNPDDLRFVAFCDIRPSNQASARRTFEEKYGAGANKNIKFYEDYNELVNDPNVEMVIIAVPLHLHSAVSIAASKAGKHVLCEKLMAKTVMQCKEMVREAEKAGRLLAVGHQRHYSYMYANALELIQRGDILGDIRHIRAWWHRNQTAAGSEGAEMGKYDSWFRKIPEADLKIDCRKYGYKSIEELIRWRLYGRTGGGLMVELGSHQLDAASIMLGKIHPEAVQGVGKTSFFKDGREVEDHVFLTYEFPNEVVVTYSSICTNAFDKYGEQVMGTKGTLILESERNAYLFKEGGDSRNTRITWAEDRVGHPTTTSTSTIAWVTGIGTPDTLTSRGYREEQEHMAWLIRHPDSGDKPRCDGRTALGDAVVTLASNIAMRQQQRIVYKPSWFDPATDAAPEKEFPGETTA